MHLHPYGSGSLGSEPFSGGFNGIPRLCRNRLLLIQSAFRDNAIWGFFQLQRMITAQLFYQQLLKRKMGRKNASSPTDADPLTRLFGTVTPSNIVESTAWWKTQSKQLFAISVELSCKDLLHDSVPYCTLSLCARCCCAQVTTASSA